MNILDGRKVAQIIKKNLEPNILKLKDNNIIPGLGIIIVGDNIESVVYVRMKRKACAKLGIKCFVKNLDKNIDEDSLIKEINILNEDTTIHGILVQLPLPEHINPKRILEYIDYNKDVDGFHPLNFGKLSQNNEPLFIPCTPLGCIKLLEHYDINVKGMDTTIIGCSNLVGLPLSLLLLHKNATVTICHRSTKDVKKCVQNADLIIACCGVTHLVKEDWVKKDAIIIDIGINKLLDNTKKRGYRLVGDVDFENVKSKTKYITPVPGGVGPMTIAMLLFQIVKSAENFLLKNTKK